MACLTTVRHERFHVVDRRAIEKVYAGEEQRGALDGIEPHE